MRSRLLAVGTLVALLSTTAPLVVSAQNGTLQAPGAPPVRRMAGRKQEGHPALMAALRALQRAKVALNRGSRDFGGHRAKADQLTGDAIKEVQAALQYDKN